jgi:NAD(P)-dependent dehydrogenase (short-subunit alcohol dehydrogenase family)
MSVPSHHIVPLPPAFDKPPYPRDIFAGQTVLVSGGGSGMGLAMARAFAQGGAQVAVMGRNLEKAQAAAAGIAELGVKTHGMNCDVRLPDQVAAAFDEAERKLARQQCRRELPGAG